MKISRRKAIQSGLAASAALPLAAGSLLRPGPAMASTAAGFDPMFKYIREVPYYTRLEDKMVRCEICPKECRIGDTERGFCGNKENRGGTYYTLAYGNACSANVDPVEKKPLYHFLPATRTFSIAAAGCNFDCKFCQNWQISQSRPEQIRSFDLPPDAVVKYARDTGCDTISYTYGEPVVFYKYMYDCAVEGLKQNVRSLMVSNGFINPRPLKQLCGVLEAIKIDYKAHTDTFYRNTCLGSLKPVQEAVKIIKGEGVWLELVYLMIPTLNDSPEEIRRMAGWIIENLGPDTPIHFSRFQPTYKLQNLPPTPIASLETALGICSDAGINFVYIGNVRGHRAESTFCPGCGATVIQRFGYEIQKINMIDGSCQVCGRGIPGVWS